MGFTGQIYFLLTTLPETEELQAEVHGSAEDNITRWRPFEDTEAKAGC